MPTCRVCDGDRLEQFLDLGDQPHCNSLLAPEDLGRPEPVYPLRVWFCHDCATVQIDHTVPKEVMFGQYLYVSGTTRTLTEHFRQSTERLIERLGLAAGDLVVDIGSNDGTWLKWYQPRGLRVLGVEAARNIAATANAEGVPTLNRFFNDAVARDILAEHGRPRLVTAAGVFFHLEELHSATAGIARLIGDDGVFCVQAIYLGEILAHNEFDNIYHEHLTYWTLHSISRLLARHGLEPFAARLVPIHGGTMELLVARQGRRPVEPSVTVMLAEERSKGYQSIGTYHAFAANVWRMKARLWAILDELAVPELSVHAFGAPAKGATLLNSFGITVDRVPLAVERNPLKIGKVIPGARIPIVDEATTPRADAYLILPWNFLDEFLRRNRDYILGGGRFVVPVPEPMVIDKANYAHFAR